MDNNGTHAQFKLQTFITFYPLDKQNQYIMKGADSSQSMSLFEFSALPIMHINNVYTTGREHSQQHEGYKLSQCTHPLR
jgi:hypothetical protein